MSPAKHGLMATSTRAVLVASLGCVAACGDEVPVASSSLTTCSLKITSVTGTTVGLAIDGLPANQAHTYGNFVAIWQSTIVPWSAAPLSRQELPFQGQSGSYVMTNLGLGALDYVVLYGVGEGITPACAVAHIPATGLPMAPGEPVDLEITSVSSDGLEARYRTYPGYRPMTFGNWIGLWQGEISPYDAPAPLAQAKISRDVDADAVSLSVAVAPDTRYTLVYFTGPELTEAAAILSIRTRARD